MPASVRLYRSLLHLYPAAFRDEYGDEMAWAFTQRVTNEPSWRVWPRALLDLIGSAAREHVEITQGNIRVGLRSLSRVPVLTSVIVLALALGIGASTAVYTVVRQVLWEPLPYAEPGGLAVVLQEGRGPLAPGTLLDVRDQVPAFADVGAAELWGPTWTGAAHPERLPAMRVTSNLFSVLGVSAARGRTLDSSDTRAIVLSHRFWQERFGGADDVVGRTLVLEGEAHTVVGVMPPSFVFAPFWARADVWGPLDLAAKRADRVGASLRAFARLAPGATFAVANQQVSALSSRLATAYPDAHRDLRLTAQSLQSRATGEVQPLLLTLLLAVGCVLLVTCVNVASLLLARAVQRQPEMVVRAALGGRSTAITRQLLTESLMLGTGSAVLGLGIAYAIVSALPSLSRLGLRHLESVAIDWHVAAVAAGLGMMTGLVFGLAPVWSARRGLRLGARGASDSARARQLRAVFVVAEVTIAVLLVVTAGLLVRSFQRLASVDPGFRPDGLAALEVSARSSATWQANRGELFRQVLERLRHLPNVSAASVINHVPLAGDAWGSQPLLEGREGEPRPHAVWRVAGPGYAAAMGIRVRDGREFTDQDVLGGPGVALVNETFARKHFDGAALGRRLSFTRDGEPAEWRTIVGVLVDVRQQEWSAPAEPEVYVPLQQTPQYLTAPSPHTSAMTVVVRGTADAERVAAQVRETIWSLDADLAISQPVLLAEEVDKQIWRPKFSSLLVSGFGVLALLLAATGIYGLVAHDASRRTREIGIRLALGASVRGVVTSVLARGLWLVSGGLVIGVVAALVGTTRLEHLLFGIEPHDTIVYGVTVLMVVLVGLAACSVPAWRASRTNAAAALRTE